MNVNQMNNITDMQKRHINEGKTTFIKEFNSNVDWIKELLEGELSNSSSTTLAYCNYLLDDLIKLMEFNNETIKRYTYKTK